MKRVSAASEAHLSDDQIDDLLIESSIAGVQVSDEHLKHCAMCRTRVAEMAESIEAFSQLTLAWSERRSSTLQPVVLAAAEWTRPLHWAVGAAVVLCGMLFLSANHHRADHTEPHVAARSVASAQSQPRQEAQNIAAVMPQHLAVAALSHPVSASSDELDRDNRMLQDIDEEWDTASPSPADSYGLRMTSAGDAAPHLAPL